MFQTEDHWLSLNISVMKKLTIHSRKIVLYAAKNCFYLN
jgi:hypothetical protein